MESIIFTPRLKLTLITKAERDSAEFEWIHKLRSDEKAMFWSLSSASKSIEDTENAIAGYISIREEDEKKYRVTYAVHRVSPATKSAVEDDLPSAEQENSLSTTEFIGVVGLKSLNSRSIALPDDLLNLSPSAATMTLAVGLDYMFLPGAWGKGYATESVKALLETCKKANSFWAPFPKLYVRTFVCERNPASLRVMEKTGIPMKGVFHWSGEPIFVGGELRDHDNLHMFGMYMFE